jgi:hypothetical protein
MKLKLFMALFMLGAALFTTTTKMQGLTSCDDDCRQQGADFGACREETAT